MSHTKERCLCFICNKSVTANSSNVGSHVKRVHHIPLNDYVRKYYKNITNASHKKEKCSCGEKYAEETFHIDHVNKTYRLSYENGFICETFECKDKTTLKVLGQPYDAKIYEHIGSKPEYLSYKYKISIEESLRLKGVNYETVKRKNANLSEEEIQELLKQKLEAKEKKPYRTNLEDYIKRYGEEEGTRKYNERCQKISKANTKDFFIERYGLVDGEERWESYLKRIKNVVLGTQKSKVSDETILSKLIDLGFSVECEYGVEIKTVRNGRHTKRVTCTDYYIKELNLVIEFYGDYWHANPKHFKDEFFMHKSIKKTVSEIWKRDRDRIANIASSLECAVLIVWESTARNLDINDLKQPIEFLKSNKTILTI
jgi:hypothetical protein